LPRKNFAPGQEQNWRESFNKLDFEAGLPDCIFSNQKIQIRVNFRGSWNGKCRYFMAIPMVYFMAFWLILRSFGTFFPDAPRKIWQPCFADVRHYICKLLPPAPQQ
jgi:hypothetical protein